MTEADALSREDLAALLDLAGALSTQADQQKVVLSILQRACELTHSPEGSILLYDPIREGLFFAAATGSSSGELLQKFGERSNQRVPLRGSKAGEAFTSGEITISGNLQTDAKHFKSVDDQVRGSTLSLISAPLKIGRSTAGVLQLLNKTDASGRLSDYGRQDIALLEYLGRIAAAAINNVRLARKLIAQTGLYGRDDLPNYLDILDKPVHPERLTFLFADMRGFTQLCQTQSDAASTQTILNDFLGMLADQVLRRGGIVNSFIGDAVFAIFQGKGAPAAVRCAFDILERFDSLRLRWLESSNEDLSFIDVRIGITTGTAAVGSFGSAEVKSYTAIGTVVNLASSFEGAARNGRRVLVDNATWAAVQDIVEEFDGPRPFDLGKADQAVKIRYQHYHYEATHRRPAAARISEPRAREPATGGDVHPAAVGITGNRDLVRGARHYPGGRFRQEDPGRTTQV